MKCTPMTLAGCFVKEASSVMGMQEVLAISTQSFGQSSSSFSSDRHFGIAVRGESALAWRRDIGHKNEARKRRRLQRVACAFATKRLCPRSRFRAE